MWSCSALRADWRLAPRCLGVSSRLFVFFAAFLPFREQNQDVCYMMQCVSAERDFFFLFLFLGWTSNITHLNLFFPLQWSVCCWDQPWRVCILYILVRKCRERIWAAVEAVICNYVLDWDAVFVFQSLDMFPLISSQYVVSFFRMTFEPWSQESSSMKSPTWNHVIFVMQRWPEAHWTRCSFCRLSGL